MNQNGLEDGFFNIIEVKESIIDYYYYNIYYYLNIIDNILSGSDYELLGFISNFFDVMEYFFV